MNMNIKKTYTRVIKNKSLTPFYTLACVFMDALSAYLLSLPLLKDITGYKGYVFTLVGAAGTVYFTFLAFNFAYQLFRPKNALLVSDEGFLDLINGGSGAGFVPWDNVASIEMCGRQGRPYIGVHILDANEIIKNSGRALEKQIVNHIELNKPELVIRPFEVGLPLEEVREILRERRAAYFKGVGGTDTNVLFPPEEDIAPTRPLPVKEIENAVKKSRQPESLIPPESEEKDGGNIDELLSELSRSIKKSRQKLDGEDENAGNQPGKDIEKELSDILQYLKSSDKNRNKDKSKDNEEKGKP
ncbi:MAG: STM3941 family protein [Eubacteriales bacterium]